MPDSPVPVVPPQPPVEAPDKEVVPIPEGDSAIHARVDAGEIWRLCCRLRLGMKEERLGIKDAHTALLMAYPDLRITQKDLRRFMEDYVDTAIVTDPSFWLKGLMRSKARLNAVVAAAEIAEDMHDVVRKAKGKVGTKDGPTLSEYTLAAQRAQSARAKQHELQTKVGFGPPTPEDQAKPTGSTQIIVKTEEANFNLSDAVGGSWARRASAIDAEGKAKAPG